MKNLAYLSIIICSFIFCSQNVFACTCGISPPICSEYAESETVFIGKVVGIKTPSDHNPYEKVEIQVQKNFKGMSSNTVWTTVGMSSCDYEGFEVGKTFLIYGSLDDKDKTYFKTNYCSRTREYKEDLNDFEFLNLVDESKTSYLISGKIFKQYNEPLQGIKAQITDNKKKTIVKSDQNGNFNIKVSKEGKYNVKIFPPKEMMFDFSPLESSTFVFLHFNKILKDNDFEKTSSFVDYEIEVKANSCGWFYLPLQKYQEDEENSDETNNN